MPRAAHRSGLCKHCKKRKGYGRGLCKLCTRDPEIRAAYNGVRKASPVVSATNGRLPLPDPTLFLPGTLLKQKVISDRWDAKQQLWHPLDAATTDEAEIPLDQPAEYDRAMSGMISDSAYSDGEPTVEMSIREFRVLLES